MCGIAGVYRTSGGKLPAPDRCTATTDALAHRGPEAAGSWTDAENRVWFGHRRLAIIDLDARANQPFVRDGLSLTFNGEIYNYRELRDLLIANGYKLQTNSDTEAILLLYKIFGEGCLKHLRGMFAFAIFDENTGELFCARDRIGEKPFVYAATPGAFVFASEIPALHATGLVPQEIDEEGAWKSLYGIRVFRRIPEPFSAWKYVEKLPPASWLRVKDGEIVDRGTYWHAVPDSDESITPKDVRKAVVEAIELTTVADVPLSVLLSGGVDSTIIAGVLTKELGKLVTGYAFGRDEHDPEITRARDAAKEYGIPLREFYFGDSDIKKEMSTLIQTYGEPFYLQPAAYASILLRAVRADGMKVVLGGNGADELFYGYTSHGRTRLASQALQLVGVNDAWPLKRRKLLKGAPAGAGEALDAVYDNVSHLIDPFRDRPLLDLASAFALVTENAHSITFLGDVAGMEHAVEMRSPFLDYKLVELAARIPMNKKVPKAFDSSGVSAKWILREAFTDLVPERILTRPKMGFGYAIGETKVFGDGGTDAFASWSEQEWRKLFS